MKQKEVLSQFKEACVRVFGDNLQDIILFGSHARGEATTESDIDVLVILNNDDPGTRRDVYSLVVDTFLKTDVYLSVKVISEEHRIYLREKDASFITNVEREGIRI